MRFAHRQTQSKDLVFADSAMGSARNFRVVIRFFDEHETECSSASGREAVKECGPLREETNQRVSR